ncbi:hypothetical protein [Pseudonocardia sp. TRM90224]|uniref:hypothetical protein n=1 Tax=Pseudonocardia sp. TRM90224 TaxID=2812678 RepID=UPI001E312ACF|nr:hypothetical protein [Pseudonocardia sp. TRM90224]
MSVETRTDVPPGTAAPAEARRMLRTLARGTATPDRLRRVGAVLVVGCVVFALVSLFDGLARSGDVRDAGQRIAVVRADAAELYRSLADSDAMATSGYVAGGIEPADVRARYDADIASAADRIVHAAGLLPADDPAAEHIKTISQQLPVYNGLIETARVYNRQGLPLGQSYLDSGSKLMRSTILPAVDKLRMLENEALSRAYGEGIAFPFIVLVLGIAVLAGLVDVTLREQRRTNRTLNLGLAGAAVAMVLALLWWSVALLVGAAQISQASTHRTAATALDDARIQVLQARSNESLVLVARGGGSADSEFTKLLEKVLGPNDNGGLLADAQQAGVQVESIRSAAIGWREAHRKVREADDNGNFPEAVKLAVGPDPTGSGATFERLDAALGLALDTQRKAFDDNAGAASAALAGLMAGPTVLALIAAGAVIGGVARRVGEYR